MKMLLTKRRFEKIKRRFILPKGRFVRMKRRFILTEKRVAYEALPKRAKNIGLYGGFFRKFIVIL